jgi:hypothetical protein
VTDAVSCDDLNSAREIESCRNYARVKSLLLAAAAASDKFSRHEFESRIFCRTATYKLANKENELLLPDGISVLTTFFLHLTD